MRGRGDSLHRHGRTCPGYPRLYSLAAARTWMPGTTPGMTKSECTMILPDGYSDVPAGTIAAVVTHLQMTERPKLPPAPSVPWTLRHIERPDLAWYRDLYRRVAEEWLWFSRIRSTDDKLA